MFKFRDRDGLRVPGITKALLSRSKKGVVAIKAAGLALDLRSAMASQLQVRWDVGALTFAGSADCEVKSKRSRVAVKCKRK